MAQSPMSNGYVGNQFIAQHQYQAAPSGEDGSESVSAWTDTRPPTSPGIAGVGAVGLYSEAPPLPVKRGFAARSRPISEVSSASAYTDSTTYTSSAPRTVGTYRPLPIPPSGTGNDATQMPTQNYTNPNPSQDLGPGLSQQTLDSSGLERGLSPDFVRHEDAGALPQPQLPLPERERIELPPLYGDVPSGTA